MNCKTANFANIVALYQQVSLKSFELTQSSYNLSKILPSVECVSGTLPLRSEYRGFMSDHRNGG